MTRHRMDPSDSSLSLDLSRLRDITEPLSDATDDTSKTLDTTSVPTHVPPRSPTRPLWSGAKNPPHSVTLSIDDLSSPLRRAAELPAHADTQRVSQQTRVVAPRPMPPQAPRHAPQQQPVSVPPPPSMGYEMPVLPAPPPSMGYQMPVLPRPYVFQPSPQDPEPTELTLAWPVALVFAVALMAAGVVVGLLLH